jgi:ORF6N domain
MPTKTTTPTLPVSIELIERRIYLVRGLKVMLDADLAELYQVETFNLNKAVKRNLDRFPADFMFQLTSKEADSLRFQIGMSKPSGRGGRRYLPYAFTELGVAMLSSVLNSKRAVHMNIVVMRAFVRLRELLATHKDLARKIEELAATQGEHGIVLSAVVKEIKKLKSPPPAPPKRPIGFMAD